VQELLQGHCCSSIQAFCDSGTPPHCILYRMSSDVAPCANGDCKSGQPRLNGSNYCSPECQAYWDEEEVAPETVVWPTKCSRARCLGSADLPAGDNRSYCSVGCMWEAQQEKATASEAQVLFFHTSDPALWLKITDALQAISQKLEAGAIASAEELVRCIQQVRAVAAVPSDRPDSASSAFEDFTWAASSVQEEARQYRLSNGELSDQGAKICEASELLGPVFLFVSKLVLDLPILFPVGLPMMVQGKCSEVLLTRRQCAALLAASLFGALPGKSVQQEQVTHPLDLSGFCFSYLMNYDARKSVCLLSYFVQVSTATEKFLQEQVSFTRRVEKPFSDEDWRKNDRELSPVLVEEGAIEDSEGHIQADFANEYLGGGALEGGQVQEEIRFAVCPECYVGMLFCERMDFNEVIFIVGTQQYCDYQGYAHTFHFMASRGQKLLGGSADEYGRRGPHIAAFDALVMFNRASQYGTQSILRELAKAHVACLGDTIRRTAQVQLGFATGNWGCGAFGGDPHLKFLIQWLAASAAGRSMMYFPFHDNRVAQLPAVISAVQASGARCSDLYQLLLGHEANEGEVFPGVFRRCEGTSGLWFSSV